MSAPNRTRAAATRILNLPPVLRAVLWFCGTMAGFAGMAVSARMLHTHIETVEILFFRSLIGLLVVLPFVARTRFAIVKTRQLHRHGARAVVQFCAQLSWIYAVVHLSLADVTAIEFSVPLWTAILAVLFLGERMQRHKVIATVMGFVGVLIIMQPGGSAFSLAGLVMLIGSAGFAASGVFVKFLTRTESPLGIIFYMNMIQLPLGLIPALFVWVTPDWSDIPVIIVWGLSGLFAHYTMARALKLADITIIFPLDFLRLPLMALLGYLFFAELLDPWTAIGGILIFASNYFSIREETRRTGKAPSAH